MFVAVAASLVAPHPVLRSRSAAVSSVTVYRVPVGKAPSVGPPDALVTVVLFGGFQCAFTRRALKTLRALQASRPKEIRLVFRHHPLAVHRYAFTAAEAAVEAQRQGRFWKFVDALRAGGWKLTNADLERAGRTAGCKAGSILRALTRRTHHRAVLADVTLGQRVTVTGTPTTYINGVKVSGAQSAVRFRAAIARARARAKAMLKRPGVTRATLYAGIVQSGVAPGRARPVRVSVVGTARRGVLRGRSGRNVASARGVTPGSTSGQPTLSLRDAPALGPENALVTVILFTNFRCSYGNYIWDGFRAMQQENPGLYRLHFVHHRIGRYDRTAVQAGEAALAAHAQGRFWDLAQILFRYRHGINAKKLEEYATEIGLKLPAYRAAIAKGTYRRRIKQEVADSARFLKNTRSCPTVWVNGRTLTGYISTYKLKNELRRAAREVQGIRARPMP